jgi:hypothetical protein
MEELIKEIAELGYTILIMTNPMDPTQLGATAFYTGEQELRNTPDFFGESTDLTDMLASILHHIQTNHL